MNKSIIRFIDRFTGSASTMSNDHVYIHEGKAFSFSGNVTLAAGATHNIELTTPSKLYVHYRPEVVSSTSDIASVEFFEGATVSGATSITAYNRNRNSSKSTQMSLHDDVTASVDGSNLYTLVVGSGGTPQSRGGGSLSGQQEEYVFEPETTYMLRITNIGSSSTDVYYTIFWYEEGEGV